MTQSPHADGTRPGLPGAARRVLRAHPQGRATTASRTSRPSSTARPHAGRRRRRFTTQSQLAAGRHARPDAAPGPLVRHRSRASRASARRRRTGEYGSLSPRAAGRRRRLDARRAPARSARSRRSPTRSTARSRDAGRRARPRPRLLLAVPGVRAADAGRAHRRAPRCSTPGSTRHAGPAPHAAARRGPARRHAQPRRARLPQPRLPQRSGQGRARRPAGSTRVVEFLPQDYTFTKGSRIGLMLQGSNTVWAVPGNPGFNGYFDRARRRREGASARSCCRWSSVLEEPEALFTALRFGRSTALPPQMQGEMRGSERGGRRRSVQRVPRDLPWTAASWSGSSTPTRGTRSSRRPRRGARRRPCDPRRDPRYSPEARALSLEKRSSTESASLGPRVVDLAGRHLARSRPANRSTRCSAEIAIPDDQAARRRRRRRRLQAHGVVVRPGPLQAQQRPKRRYVVPVASPAAR